MVFAAAAEPTPLTTLTAAMFWVRAAASTVVAVTAPVKALTT